MYFSFKYYTMTSPERLAQNTNSCFFELEANAKALAEELMSRGHKFATDGTDNHLLLWDLRPKGLSGQKMEKICEVLKRFNIGISIVQASTVVVVRT